GAVGRRVRGCGAAGAAAPGADAAGRRPRAGAGAGADRGTRVRCRARAAGPGAASRRDRGAQPTRPAAHGRAAAHPALGPGGRMRSLTGRQKAAVVLMNIDRLAAIEVMKHLTETEAEAITTEIIGLQHVDAELTAQALKEFQRMAAGHLPPARGGRDLAATLLEASFGSERAAALLGRVGSSNSAFDFLGAADPSQVAGLLDGELPQTVALVLAHLTTEQAAAVLAALPEATRSDVAHAIATMGTATQDAIAIVAESLRARTGMLATRDAPERLGGVQPLVEIINRSDASIEKTLLESIESRDRSLADDIRSRMFTFSDIVRLDDRDAQRV